MVFLEVDSLVKRYEQKVVLSDVALSCSSGEIIGVYGLNGSGKSTLLKAIAGFIQTDNIFLKINEKVIRSSREYKGRIKYLGQNSLAPAYLRVKKVIQLFGCEEIVKDNLIKDLIEYRIRDLSGGQRRLIELVSILYSKSEIILLDEPFRGLAPIMIHELSKRIKVVSKIKGVIITDSLFEEVFKISNKNYYLSNGFLRLAENKHALREYLKGSKL